MLEWIDKIGWNVISILCLTIGLTPYNPPHIWEKLNMLVRRELVRPIDWFDLFLHGFPWVFLVLKVAASLRSH
jgi:hypothetical protein